MAIGPGTRLGPYEVTALIGAGGMGEVYRATDTHLGRQVAIKVLPEAFAGESDRLARFEREAKTLASLNHPNIAIIHGLEKADGIRALVMELVEGPTLADRIAQGPIPVDEALPIAKQIAEALDAAHERGIIHRDLKPANIKLRPDGTVKVLDFGLAKTIESMPAAGMDATASPTITNPAMMTGVGVLLGTAAYMSPEQARGRTVDKRSDIWAFGCVLYEMLTGKRAFEGEDVSETLAAVLRSEPDWAAITGDVPAATRSLIQECLAKDPRQRVGDIAVARFVLADPARLARSEIAPVVRSGTRRWDSIILIAVAALVTAAAVSTLMTLLRSPSPPLAVMRFPIPLPESQVFASSGLPVIAVSPDGRHVAYAAGTIEAGVSPNTPATQRLYLRSMSDGVARPIPGTESPSGVGGAVFSPDGRSLVYFVSTPRNLGGTGVLGRATGALKRISVEGGAAVTLCELELPLGISWTGDSIVFGQRMKGIMRVSATGGEPERIVSVAEGEVAQGPHLLPGGDAVVFALGTWPEPIGPTDEAWDRAQIVVQSLESGERKTVVRGGSDAQYVSTGHLVYATGGTLRAVPFDTRRLEVTGGSVTVVEGVRRSRFGPITRTGLAHYALSETGALVYLPGPAEPSSALQDLGFLERNAVDRTEPFKLPAALYEFPRVSPGGGQIAVGTNDGQAANIWVYDLAATSPLRQLTFGGTNRFPIWSPDGQHVAFQSDREGDRGIFSQRVDGTTPSARLTTAAKGVSHIPDSWSPDGNQVLFDEETESGFALWIVSVRDKKPAIFGDVKSRSVPPAAVYSPDGRWVAYQSGEIPDPELFVQPFPAGNAKYKVARGRSPRWSRDGKQLLYLVTNRIFAVAVSTQSGFSVGNPVPIAQGFTTVGMRTNYDITADGTRFVGIIDAPGQIPSPTAAARHIEVVVNWFEELKQRVPAN